MQRIKHWTIFDLETGPLCPQTIEEMEPEFKAPGNWKDPVKIAIKREEQRKAFHERAALNPMTSQVLCIGYGYSAHRTTSSPAETDEKAILKQFWDLFEEDQGYTWVGFCIFHFDLPYLLKRSWCHGIDVPPIRKGHYWHDRFVDLQEVWQCGDRQCGGSLDAISTFFGGPKKLGSGADFAAKWVVDRAAAIEYLHRDLEITEFVARRMGVIE